MLILTIIIISVSYPENDDMLLVSVMDLGEVIHQANTLF